MKKIMLLSAALLMFSFQALAMECDNFTGRDKQVRDSVVLLDFYANMKMDEAMLEANESSDGCNARRLIGRIEDRVGRTPVSQIEFWAQDAVGIQKTHFFTEDNIYKGTKFWHYPLTKISGIISSIKVNGQVVGLDKLGHFFAEGLNYYRKVTQKRWTLDEAMIWGITTEEGIFGLGMSGVKSYADLSANYAGFRFWSNVVDSENPYFFCKGGKWQRNRRFSWKEYVTAAWDEGVNCSEYDPRVAPYVMQNFKELGVTCPVKGREADCLALGSLEHAHRTVSPVCRRLIHNADFSVKQRHTVTLKGRHGA